MKIVIVNTLSIPSGAASVNRILSYAEGLIDSKNEVTILSTATGNTLKFNYINGIRYKNLGTSSIKIISLFISLCKLCYNILFNKYDCIILASNSLLLIYPLFLIAYIKKISFVQEKSEYPFVLLHQSKSFFHKIYAKAYIKTTYKLFDGMIIISDNLMNYFKDKIRKNCQLIKIPMTVDAKRFTKIDECNTLGNYVAYCGDMSGNKDGVANLIQAFSIVEQKHPECKLLLIGGTSNENEFIKLKELNLSLRNNNVVFYGAVNRELIPSLLKNARALLLARPSGLQSSGGFPTKLGEYLATGKPVIVTKVGDIPNYLIDNKNAFLVDPDNNLAFGNKICSVLEHYNEAINIGIEGKKLSETIFNGIKQGRRIDLFLRNL